MLKLQQSRVQSDTVESEGLQMKQCWIKYLKHLKNPPLTIGHALLPCTVPNYVIWITGTWSWTYRYSFSLCVVFIARGNRREGPGWLLGLPFLLTQFTVRETIIHCKIQPGLECLWDISCFFNSYSPHESKIKSYKKHLLKYGSVYAPKKCAICWVSRYG